MTEENDLQQAFELLIEIYKRYIEMDKRYYPVVSAWVIAANFQKAFPSFPYLFLNAMKGSGKSRFLKLTAHLLNGVHTTSMTEAVLFRDPAPLMLDEIENINKKEKAGLRELLNQAYKKGSVIKRSRKIERTGNQILDEFEVYRPIVMANIEGLDDVLEDRCIKIVLEKSFNKSITRKLELFDKDKDISKFRDLMVSVVSANVVRKKTIEDTLDTLFIHYNTLTTQMYINTNCTNTTLQLITKLDATDLQGRDLELWYPIFIIGASISEAVLDDLIKSAILAADERKTNNQIENRDVILINFLYSFIKDKEPNKEFHLVSELVKTFLEQTPDELWFNAKWLGRALQRNKLIIEKRRQSRGMEVVLAYETILDKAKKFGIVPEASLNLSEKLMQKLCSLKDAEGKIHAEVLKDKLNLEEGILLKKWLKTGELLNFGTYTMIADKAKQFGVEDE